MRKQRITTCQPKWWPLSKCCLKLMLSNGLEHEHRQEITVQLLCSTFFIVHAALTRYSFLSVWISHFFSLTPSSFFPPSHFSVRQRKLEIQEHIVTVGSSHLRSHLWHWQALATWALDDPWPDCGQTCVFNKDWQTKWTGVPASFITFNRIHSAHD